MVSSYLFRKPSISVLKVYPLQFSGLSVTHRVSNVSFIPFLTFIGGKSLCRFEIGINSRIQTPIIFTSTRHTLASRELNTLTPPIKFIPESGNRVGSRRTIAVFAGTGWNGEESPYDILELERIATIDEIKSAYRLMAKKFHPDVYDGSVELSEGETAASRFIRIQAAYELLMDSEERMKYDREHRQNPMKASRAWVEWVMKKKKAFEQRGDLAASHWAEQQQREVSLKARNLSKAKMDPEEERRLREKERLASLQNFETTLKRHSLVLKKRDLKRQRAESASVAELLALEGFELDDQQNN